MTEKQIAEIIHDYVSPENDLITENQERHKAASEILKLFSKSQAKLIIGCQKYIALCQSSDMRPEDECMELLHEIKEALGSAYLILEENQQ